MFITISIPKRAVDKIANTYLCHIHGLIAICTIESALNSNINITAVTTSYALQS